MNITEPAKQMLIIFKTIMKLNLVIHLIAILVKILNCYFAFEPG